MFFSAVSPVLMFTKLDRNVHHIESIHVNCDVKNIVEGTDLFILCTCLHISLSFTIYHNVL